MPRITVRVCNAPDCVHGPGAHVDLPTYTMVGPVRLERGVHVVDVQVPDTCVDAHGAIRPAVFGSMYAEFWRRRPPRAASDVLP